MILPTKKTPPKQKHTEQSILVYGLPKIGKSTLASQFPNTIFLATVPGLNNLEVFQVQIKTWIDLQDAIKELHKGKHNFKTIVIDTIDNAYKLCSEYICKQNDIKHESELGYGKGYALIKQEFEKVITLTANMPYGFLLISHSNTKEIETRTGKKTVIVPTLHYKVLDGVLALMDIILYCDIDYDKEGKPTRIMHTKPSDKFTAGDRTGKLPAKIKLNYNEFVKYFEPLKKEEKSEPNEKLELLTKVDTKKDGKK